MKNFNQPKFTVIIPVYNVEKYVKQCIESVINQTYQDYEVIITDDCGNDNSIKIIKELIKNNSKFKIVKHKKNRGLAAARNSALKKARGKYIVCLDSDDWMEENCLEIINAIFVKYGTSSVWFNAKKYFENSKSFAKEPMYKQTDGYRELTPENIAAFADFTWIKAYTRDSIQKYKLCWPEGLTFEDGEFYFKYFTLNPRTYVIADCLINYRYRDDSIVRNADRGNVHMEHIYQVLRNLKTFWENLGYYDRYKVTMLKLLQNRIRMCYGLNYCNEFKKLSLELLNDFNYPQTFKDFDIYNRNKTPLVTIAVLITNVEKYLEQCLNSVIHQTYQNLEIICVDDCSKDSSKKIAEKYQNTDNRIRIISHENVKGPGGSRNTALKNANGEFIFFIDGDDYIELQCVEIVVSKLIETNYNTVFFKADVLFDEIQKRMPIWFKNYRDFKEGKFIINENNMCSLPHYCWNKGYKKDFLLKNNIFWLENLIYQDQEFFFKLFINSPYTYMIDEPLYIYRRRENSIIGECYHNQKNAEDLYKVTIHIKNYLKENNLLNKYKKSFLQLLMNNINNYREIPDTHNKLIPQMLACINELNFPNDFE